MQQRAIETRKKILRVCVRLFLEQGYKATTVSHIVEEAKVARGSYQNLFPSKEDILLELIETMFSNQFSTAQNLVEQKLTPVYIYATETAIQLSITEFNENLREIYVEAYTLPNTSEYIYEHTAVELKRIFGEHFPGHKVNDFYEMEIGTAGLMRNYMAKKCDIHFPFEAKLRCFLMASLSVYKVPEKEQEDIIAFIEGIDIKAAATKVMHDLFSMLEMKYDFKLPKAEQ